MAMITPESMHEMGKIWFLLTILIILAAVSAVYFFGPQPLRFKTRPTPQDTFKAYDADGEKYAWDIEVIASGLEVPWDLALTDEGEIFITERAGKVKLLKKDGSIQTISNFPQVASVGESGMTGLALHPDFRQNGYIFIYYTYRVGGEILNRISRFTYKNNRLTDEVIILDKLPGGVIHNGGRMRFGPDQKLWILTGDAARPSSAQDIKSLSGKVLRINDDGSYTDGNAFKNSPVFSFGHRNPQGLDFHPLTEQPITTEHGETAYDEVNLIKAGKNYGWPDNKKCFSDDLLFENPILCSGEFTWAPSGAAFLGSDIWRLRNSYFFAGLRGQILERVDIVDGRVTNRETIIKDTYGRLRAVVSDKKGHLYVSTSNLDGRGNPKQGDDKILKLTPKKIE